MHLVVWIACDEPPRLGGLHVSVSQKFGSPTPAEGWHTCTQLRKLFRTHPHKKKTFLGTQKFHEHLKFASSPFYHILTLLLFFFKTICCHRVIFFYHILPHSILLYFTIFFRFSKPLVSSVFAGGRDHWARTTGAKWLELCGRLSSRFGLEDTKALAPTWMSQEFRING